MEPKSPIVAKVEQAGSGNLAAVSKDGIREWLDKHKDVAYQVDEMCKPVRQKATAQWAESTEGRLCTAARELAFFRSGPVTGDDKTYLPGLK
jgi:flagellar basal body rod protein FlgF